MQPSLFKQEPLTQESTSPVIVERRVIAEDSGHSREYCVREILYEQYLWDMRCWHKPKFQYSKEEIREHIYKWLSDHAAGNWTSNCGHCLYCLRRLLVKKWANWDVIVSLVMRNNNIKYPNEIGTWGNGFDQ